MPHFNKVYIMGHLTRDIELKYLLNQTAVANFGIATNRKWKTPQGEDREEVLFVDCTAFGRQAETLEQYVQKGSPLFIEGRLKLDVWEDKNGGGKRSKISLVVETFQFLGKSDGGGQQAGGEHAGSDSAPPAPPAQRQQQSPAPARQSAPPHPSSRARTATADPMQRTRQAQAPAISEDANPISEQPLFKPDDIPF